jgi:soluble lytic murein transglycosylase-like protein
VAFGPIADQATRVAQCESSLNPGAVSPGGGNYGLFQINRVHSGQFQSVTGQPWSNVTDPYANARYAAWVYNQSGGWGPWTCRWAA